MSIYFHAHRHNSYLTVTPNTPQSRFKPVLLFLITSDFEISYQLPQSTENGKRPDVFISLTSDFDLDAAFMSSSLPYLSLKIEPVVCSGDC